MTAEDEAQGTELVPANPKYLANIAITGATADASGRRDGLLHREEGTTSRPSRRSPRRAPASSSSMPAGGRSASYNRWVPYIYRSGRTVNAGYRESNATTRRNALETRAGTYTYTFGRTSRRRPSRSPVSGTASSLVGYDRALTHRVSVYIGGHAGPTGEADFDFVPDGAPSPRPATSSRPRPARSATANEFHGHGGDRVHGGRLQHLPQPGQRDGEHRHDAAGVPPASRASRCRS